VENNVEPDMTQTTIWRMRIICCTPKATNTYSGYVIIVAVPQQQWLHIRASMLRCTYSTLSEIPRLKSLGNLNV